jgi:hypothetical protein
MGVLWLIAVAATIGWLFGIGILPEYSPWIHVLAVIAAAAFVTLAVRRRPRVQQRA